MRGSDDTESAAVAVDDGGEGESSLTLDSVRSLCRALEAAAAQLVRLAARGGESGRSTVEEARRMRRATTPLDWRAGRTVDGRVPPW
jgi:hypothetical protein